MKSTITDVWRALITPLTFLTHAINKLFHDGGPNHIKTSPSKSMDWLLYNRVPHIGTQVTGPWWGVPGPGSHVKVPGPGSQVEGPGSRVPRPIYGYRVLSPGSNFSGMPIKWNVFISSSLRLLMKMWIWYRCQNRIESYYHHDVEQLGTCKNRAKRRMSL